MNGSPVLLILWLVFLVAVMYLLMIRPQQKRLAAHRALIESLGAGHKIVTMGGIHGTIKQMGEDTVEVTIADGVDITISRSAVAARVEEASDKADALDSGDTTDPDDSTDPDDPADSDGSEDSTPDAKG